MGKERRGVPKAKDYICHIGATLKTEIDLQSSSLISEVAKGMPGVATAPDNKL